MNGRYGVSSLLHTDARARAMNSYQPYPIRRDAVLCLAELPDGGLRVVLDDLRQSDTPGRGRTTSS